MNRHVEVGGGKTNATSEADSKLRRCGGARVTFGQMGQIPKRVFFFHFALEVESLIDFILLYSTKKGNINTKTSEDTKPFEQMEKDPLFSLLLTLE